MVYAGAASRQLWLATDESAPSSKPGQYDARVTDEDQVAVRDDVRMQVLAYGSIAVALLGGGASTVLLAHLLVDRPMFSAEANWMLVAVCGNAGLLVGGLYCRVAQVRQRSIPAAVSLTAVAGGIAAALGQANVFLNTFLLRSFSFSSNQSFEDAAHWAWALLVAVPPLVFGLLLLWWWPGPNRLGMDPDAADDS